MGLHPAKPCTSRIPRKRDVVNRLFFHQPNQPSPLRKANPRHMPKRMSRKSWQKSSNKMAEKRKAKKKAVFRSRANEEASKPAVRHSTVAQNSRLNATRASYQVMPPVIK